MRWLRRCLTTHAINGTAPRIRLPGSLAELRALFLETRLHRGAADGSATYERRFSELAAESLGTLPRAGDAAAVQPVLRGLWVERYDSAVDARAQPSKDDADDTLIVGLRAELRYDDVPTGTFGHRYVAWSKRRDVAVAQGGATITCERGGEAAPVPDGWIHRLEVDHGDSWAAVKIIEFRTGAGLASDGGPAQRLQLDGFDEDLDPTFVGRRE